MSCSAREGLKFQRGSLNNLEDKIRENKLFCFFKLTIIIHVPTVLFDITYKDAFCLAFYFKWKYLFYHLSFLFLCLVFKYLLQINFMAKNGSDICNFYCKLDFWKLFCFSSFIVNYWCSVCHSEQVYLFKICTPYQCFACFAAILTMGKNWKYSILLKGFTKIKLFVYR